MPNNRALWAKHHAKNGLSVFPTARDKVPLVEDWPNLATTDLAQIDRWWAEHPEANIGCAIGRANLCVIDIDPQGGGTLMDLPLTFDERDTVTAITGRGGSHLYYKMPAGVRITNARGTLPKGIDVRGDGGYVVLPGSIHENGNAYRWEEGFGLHEKTPLVLPASLLKMLPAGNGTRPGPSPKIPDRIPKGLREATLFSGAGAMRRKGFSERAILAALEVENEDRCDPPLSTRDLQRLARSVGRYEPKCPLVPADEASRS